jgi:hypothetical protein
VALDAAPLAADGYLGRGFGQRDDCRIVVDEAFLAKCLGIVYDERRERFGRRAAFRWVCRVVVHEVGHVRGLAQSVPHAGHGGTMRRRLAVLFAAAALVAWPATQAPARSGSPAVAAAAKPCSSGWAHAVIGGAHKCLRRGQFCARRYDRQYHRYGYHCHRYDSNVDRYRLT